MAVATLAPQLVSLPTDFHHRLFMRARIPRTLRPNISRARPVQRDTIRARKLGKASETEHPMRRSTSMAMLQPQILRNMKDESYRTSATAAYLRLVSTKYHPVTGSDPRKTPNLGMPVLAPQKPPQTRHGFRSNTADRPTPRHRSSQTGARQSGTSVSPTSMPQSWTTHRLPG